MKSIINLLIIFCATTFSIFLFSCQNDNTKELVSEKPVKNDTLTYYMLITKANKAFLEKEYGTSFRHYQEAEKLNIDKFDWEKLMAKYLDSRLRDSVYKDSLQNVGLFLEQKLRYAQQLISKLEKEKTNKIYYSDSLQESLEQVLVGIDSARQINKRLQEDIEMVKNAYGKLHFINVDKKQVSYYGEISDRKANGFGLGIFDAKSFYEGEWKNNLRHGKGNYTWANKDTYEGEFVNGKRQGWGEYIFATGEKYVGEWYDDIREGEGIFYSKEGNILLQGKWQKDKFVRKTK